MPENHEYTLTGGLDDFPREEQTVTGGLDDFRREEQTMTGGVEERDALRRIAQEDSVDASEQADWEIGQIIDGKYKVLRVLGQGAMGIVYQVHHREWDLDLAVKMPLRHLVANEMLKARFVQEAQTWVNLGLHPNIVQCWYVRELGGIPRVFMDYLKGGSLKDWIKAGKVKPGEWDVILDLAIQACDGLGYAHQHGVEVHRDVKPGNMLMSAGGELRVTDFGIAKRQGSCESEEKTITIDSGAGQHTFTMTGTDLGTPEYSAPEQWGKARHADARADIYALGGVLFELCCGRRPFDDKTHQDSPYAVISRHLFAPPPDPREFNPQIPEPLAYLILQCLAKHPDIRPRSMSELREALTAIYKDLSGKPSRRSVPQGAELRSDALNNRAVSLLDLKQEHDALTAWNDALKLDAYHPESVYNKALLEWHDCHIADDEVVRRLEEAKHANSRVGMFLGMIHLERAAADRAEEEFALLLKEPDFSMNGLLWGMMGDARMAQRKYDEAQQAYHNALDVQPDDADTLQRLELAQARTRISENRLNFPWRHCSRILDGHRQGITSVAVTPDGTCAISGSTDKTIKLWDIQNRSYLRTLHGHQDAVTAVVVTPDGNTIISGSADCTLKVWDLASATLRHTLEGHSDRVTSLALTPDGQHLVSGSRDSTLRLWDLVTLQCLRVLKGHQEEVTTVAITPDGRCIVSGSEDGSRRVWEMASRKCVHVFKGKWFAKFWEAFEATTIALTPDGEHALSGGWDHALKLWNLETGQKIWSSARHEGRITAIALMPDGQHAVTASLDHTAKLWDIPMSIDVKTFQGHSKAINAVTVTPDGDTVLTGSDDKSLRLWEAHTATCCGVYAGYEGHKRAITALTVTPDGRIGISGSLDKTLKLWNLTDISCLKTLKGHRRGVTVLSMSPDGRYLVSGSLDATLRVWNLPGGQFSHVCKGHTGGITALKMSSDGQYILSGSADTTLRLWNLHTGECCRLFTGHTQAVKALEIIQDGTSALSSGEDMTLRIWDIESGNCLRTINGHACVTSITRTPDGKALLIGHSQHTLQLWDRHSMACLRVFQGHRNAVISAIVTPDKQYIISTGADGTIRLWDYVSTQCLRTFDAEHANLAAAVTPNGEIMLSGGDDGILRIWQLELEAQRDEAVIQTCRQRGHHELEASKTHFDKLIHWAQSSLKSHKLTAAYRYMNQARSVPGYERAPQALALNAQLGLSFPKKSFREGWSVHSVSAHKKSITSLAITPDGQQVVSGSQDATLRVWDINTAACLHVCEGHKAGITAVAITPDGRFIVSASEDMTLRLWDIASANCLRIYKGHTQRVTAVTLSPCGRFILSGGDDHTLRLWNPATAVCLYTVKCQKKRISAAIMTPNHQQIIAGTVDGMIGIWSLSVAKHNNTCKDVKRVNIFDAHHKAVTALAVSGDGARLLSGGQDATLRLWNLAASDSPVTLEGHHEAVTGAAITPDARFAISCSQDRTLKLWNLLTGDIIWNFEGHHTEVTAVSMTPNARFLASGSEDGILRIWELDWELSIVDY